MALRLLRYARNDKTRINQRLPKLLRAAKRRWREHLVGTQYHTDRQFLPPRHDAPPLMGGNESLSGTMATGQTCEQGRPALPRQFPCLGSHCRMPGWYGTKGQGVPP